MDKDEHVTGEEYTDGTGEKAPVSSGQFTNIGLGWNARFETGSSLVGGITVEIAS